MSEMSQLQAWGENQEHRSEISKEGHAYPQGLAISMKKLKKMTNDLPIIKSQFQAKAQKEIQMKFQNIAKQNLQHPILLQHQFQQQSHQITNHSIYSATKKSPPQNTDQKIQSHGFSQDKVLHHLHAFEVETSNFNDPEKSKEISKNNRQLSHKILPSNRSASLNNKMVEFYKLEQIQRDISLFPNKYKILCSELGKHQEEVFAMKPEEIKKIFEKYTKEKGLQYLRENSMNNKIKVLMKKKLLTEPEEKEHLKTIQEKARHKNRSSMKKHLDEKIYLLYNDDEKLKVPKTYIHEIFGNLKQKSKKSIENVKKANETHKVDSKIARLRILSQKQQMLGKVVFQRVKKHLKNEKEHTHYFNRVHSQQNIDDALIDFLKTKIDRAETALK